MKSKLIILVLFVVAILLTILVPNLSGAYIKKSKLYISEVLASNYSITLDDDGVYSDYIEIYNGYNRSIDLGNYYLSDSEFVNLTMRFAINKVLYTIENKFNSQFTVSFPFVGPLGQSGTFIVI